jgi:fucose permease
MTESPSARPKGTGLAFAYVTTLFFAWGFVTSLIGPLIAAVRRVFELSYTEATLTTFAWFIACPTEFLAVLQLPRHHPRAADRRADPADRRRLRR